MGLLVTTNSTNNVMAGKAAIHASLSGHNSGCSRRDIASGSVSSRHRRVVGPGLRRDDVSGVAESVPLSEAVILGFMPRIQCAVGANWLGELCSVPHSSTRLSFLLWRPQALVLIRLSFAKEELPSGKWARRVTEQCDAEIVCFYRYGGQSAMQLAELRGFKRIFRSPVTMSGGAGGFLIFPNMVPPESVDCVISVRQKRLKMRAKGDYGFTRMSVDRPLYAPLERRELCTHQFILKELLKLILLDPVKTAKQQINR